MGTMIAKASAGRRPRATSLRYLAEAELAHAGAGLGFPPELEARYRADTNDERARQLRSVSWVSAVVYVAVCLLLNIFVIQDPIWRNVAIQNVVTPVLGLLISWWFFRPGVAFSRRETAALASSVIYTASVIVAVYFNPPNAAVQDLVLVILPLNFAMFFARLPFTYAVAFVGLSLALHTLAVLGRSDLPAAAREFPIGFVAVVCIPSLCCAYGLERAFRRDYLHRLLQRLQIEALSAQNDVLTQLSATDALTGAANRRRLDTELKKFCAAGAQGGAFMLIDVDRFKAFNDRHGHLAGDAVLRELAGCLMAQLRRCDLLARYGGEEFAVLLPGLGRHDALDAAERLRLAVENHLVPLNGGDVSVTVSIGIADLASCPEPTILLGASDAALYEAKKSGRNCVCAAWREPAAMPTAAD
jgi:diguanylate cyclase (GGDEF)-like protein